MRPSDIDTESFYSAHEQALGNTIPEKREAEFVEQLTQRLITELARIRIAPVMENRERATSKIRAALQEVLEDKGIDFVASQPVAVKAALEHKLAARMTLSDMPPSIKESGLFKLDLPEDLEKSK